MAYQTCKCKAPLINAVSVAAQPVAAGGLVTFNQVIARGDGIYFTPGENTFILPNRGVYMITFDADVLAADTGTVSLELISNGLDIPGGTANITAGSTTTYYHMHVQGVVNVRKSCECIDNTARIQVVFGDPVSAGNANIVIRKIG